MSVDGTLERVLAKVPDLSDAVEVTELPGGLTNTNYKITTASGAYVVRVSAKDAGLLAIDRENEYLNTVAAADTGVGAAVTAYLPEENVLVLEFIVGQTQSPEDLRRGDKLDQVAAACRRLHGARRFRDDFNMFRIQARYLKIVQERGFRLPERYLEFEPQVREIEAAMAVRDEGTVPCNNDLLAENFIDVGGEFKLIDYEYSGNNDASSATFGASRTWRSSNSTSSSATTTVGRSATRSPVHASGGSCRSTGGRSGPRSRTASRRSTSTSGSGAWRSTSAP
jgi:thiamine kinase-like enzyme